MFDSGIGGLTVLRECLVALPAEDFIYIGDTARFPYGPRTQEELQEYSLQIATFLERMGVKLIVVACFSATAAALPVLQEQLKTPVVGIIMPGARAAVQVSRFRRIGVLATEATVASESYVRAIHGLDAGAEVHQQACPGLAASVEEGELVSRKMVDSVRSFTAPLKAVRPDVVIMGCTHYPLIQAMLQRHLGRDVTLVDPAAEIAVEVEEILARQGMARRGEREGHYRFLCTGDIRSFCTVGARFLQMPVEQVERVPLELLDSEEPGALEFEAPACPLPAAAPEYAAGPQARVGAAEPGGQADEESAAGRGPAA